MGKWVAEKLQAHHFKVICENNLLLINISQNIFYRLPFKKLEIYKKVHLFFYNKNEDETFQASLRRERLLTSLY